MASLPLDGNVTTLTVMATKDALWAVGRFSRERGLMIFIKHFDQLGRGDVDQAGGKGANLGELTRAGAPGAARLRGCHRGLQCVCRGTSAGRKGRRARVAEG